LTKIYLATLAMALLVCLGGCGRQELSPDAVERNRLFAEILRRADARALGDDDFFLTNLSNGADPQVQQWCAIALGQIGSPRALPLLYQARHSPLAALRAGVAFAIGEIADRDQLEARFAPADPRSWIELRAMLQDSSLVVQMRVIEALGKCAPEAEAVTIINKVRDLRYEGTPLERAWIDLAITALSRMRNRAAIPVLENLTAIEEPEIQWRAVNALTVLDATDACPLFQRLVKSDHADLRAYAARGLGICRGEDLVDTLAPLLGTRDAVFGREVPLRVRVSALHALGSLGDPAAIPVIVKALRSEPVDDLHPDHLNFAVQAAAALEEIGERLPKDAADFPLPETAGYTADLHDGRLAIQAELIRLLNSSSPVAETALLSLARLLRNKPERFFLIPRSGGDTITWVKALGKLGGTRAIAELTSMLEKFQAVGANPMAIRILPTILRALAEARAPDLDTLLLPFLTKSEAVLQDAAVDALHESDGERAWKTAAVVFHRLSEESDPATGVALLEILAPHYEEPEVQAALRRALEYNAQNVRIAAARLLRKAGASDVPEEPGPVDGSATPLTCAIVAAARRDRTTAILKTSRGDIEFELFRSDAPLTVSHFVTLARQGFYDGSPITQVEPLSMVQIGIPFANAWGRSRGPIRNEINMRPFERGSVGIVVSGKDTGGSQFFITLAPQPDLDGRNACFGKVLSGMQVVDNLTPDDRVLGIMIEEDATIIDSRSF